MIKHDSDEAKKMVKKFCGLVFWLKNVHNIFKQLFESDEAKSLMEKTACRFFMNLNEIIHHYLLLECAKITDPSKTFGHDNFTIKNMMENIDWPANVKIRLNALDVQSDSFRKYIKPARNTLLAHHGKQQVLNETRLGKFPVGEDKRFMNTMEEISNVMHEATFGEIYGKISTATRGDVSDLLTTLKRAIAFDNLLSESKGAEKARIFNYLQSI